jgi:quercetin dioxygenase-like cupin family protein
MTGIEVLTRPAIEASLEDSTRQYLTGTLHRPQELEHVEDSDLEMGLSDYAETAADQPHIHSRAREYQYVISGRAFIRELATGRTHELSAGDFYVIHPGTPYAQKSAAGTRILFVKYPAGNDKSVVAVDDETTRWLADLAF